MKYLIVNADDFGMAKGINEGIVKALREGIATSASMLAAGACFEDACRLARENGIKEVGAHLSATEVPNIVLRRKMMSRNIFFSLLLTGAITGEEVLREFRAQIERIRKAGFEITHLDSHEHIHLLPRVLRILIDLAREYNIPAVRLLREERIRGALTPEKVYRFSLSRLLTRDSAITLRKAGLFSPDHMLGFVDSGRLSEDLLIDMLGSLEDGMTELIAHPGFLDPDVLDHYRWHVNCEYELSALVSRRVKQLLDEKRVKLISYQEALREGLGSA